LETRIGMHTKADLGKLETVKYRGREVAQAYHIKFQPKQVGSGVIKWHC